MEPQSYLELANEYERWMKVREEEEEEKTPEE